MQYVKRTWRLSGNCTKGSTWTITSTNKLFEIIGDLECLWAASLTPAGVPTGYQYGKLLAFTNTAGIFRMQLPIWFFIDSLFPSSWLLHSFGLPGEVSRHTSIYRTSLQGDFTFKTQCNGVYHIVGHLKFGGLSPSYGRKQLYWRLTPECVSRHLDNKFVSLTNCGRRILRWTACHCNGFFGRSKKVMWWRRSGSSNTFASLVQFDEALPNWTMAHEIIYRFGKDSASNVLLYIIENFHRHQTSSN